MGVALAQRWCGDFYVFYAGVQLCEIKFYADAGIDAMSFARSCGLLRRLRDYILHFSRYVGARINAKVSLRERSDNRDGCAMIL